MFVIYTLIAGKIPMLPVMKGSEPILKTAMRVTPQGDYISFSLPCCLRQS